MNTLVKISEETIREIIAKFYNIRTDDVCLYRDYKFTLKNGDKIRKDFIYGIVEKQGDDVENGRLSSVRPTQRGWICPVCGRGLSPFTTVCPCQNGKGWEITCKT